jgi:hypothetical protein
MQFANIGLGGPAFPASYGRLSPIDAAQQGVVLEAWAKLGPSNLDTPTTDDLRIIALDEGPNYGLLLHNGTYVAKFQSAEFPIAQAEVGVWHHLALVRNFNLLSWYYDGNLVNQVVQDPPGPPPSTGAFWVGGMSGNPVATVNADLSGNTVEGFNGWIDEVRLQTFNPAAAGAFEPTAFLISPAPEPTGITLLALGGAALVARRRRLS